MSVNTYEEILRRMQAAFAQQSGLEADDASDIGIRLKVLASELFSAHQQAEWLKAQIFPQTATGEYLDLHAQQRGISRKDALPSAGQLTFSRTVPLAYDAPIPSGTVCSTPGVPGVRMVTTQDGILKAGSSSVSIPACSQEGGADKNAAAHAVTVLVTPPPGIEQVDNPLPFVGGADGESDEQLRQRIIQSWRIISNGTNAAFYRDYVLSFEGIRSVSVVPRAQGTGTVEIYAAAAGSAPNTSLLNEIEKNLNHIREICVDVSLLPCELVAVNLYLQVAPEEGYTVEEVRAACLERIRGYFLALSIGQPVLLAAAGDVVFHTPGVKNYSFVSSMCSDKAMLPSQLAIAGEIGISEKKEG